MKVVHKLAFGGICCGLSVVVLFFSGIFPMMEYAVPAMAGLMLVPPVVEYGVRHGAVCWISAAAIGLLLVPNREAAVLFALFFGSYPVVKAVLEPMKNHKAAWLLKFLFFNTAVLLGYFLLIVVLGLGELAAELQAVPAGPVLLLVLGNVVFYLYDRALTKLITLYLFRVRPHLK